jgi:hypothetical protein
LAANSIVVSNTGTFNPSDLAIAPQMFIASPTPPQGFVDYSIWLTEPTYGTPSSASVEPIPTAESPTTYTSLSGLADSLTVDNVNNIATSVDGKRAFVTLAVTPPAASGTLSPNFQVLNITAAPATVAANLSLTADGGVTDSLRTGQLTVDPRGQVAYVAQRISTNQIATVAVNSGGTGYVVNDILTVIQPGAVGGQLRVTSVSAGVVTGLAVLWGGADYSAASGLPTTDVTTPAANGCTVNILTVSLGTFVNVAVVSTNTASDLYSQVNTIPGAGLSPCTAGSISGLTTSQDGSRLFVVCTTDDTVHVYNISNGDPTAAIAEVPVVSPIALPAPPATNPQVAGCTTPVDLKMNAAGTRLFVSCQDSDTLVPIDYNTSTDAYTIHTAISTDPSPLSAEPTNPCGNGGSCPQLLDLMVNPPIHFTTGGDSPGLPFALPPATHAANYNQYVVVQGGTVPRSWSNPDGDLAACGFTLVTTTGEIYATPVPGSGGTTCGGTSGFVIRVTDASTPGQFVERTFTIKIN